MTLDEIRSALQDRNLVRVAEATGLHHNTLLLIRSGAIESPRRATLAVLAGYLSARDA
jgi:hypothetical protein